MVLYVYGGVLMNVTIACMKAHLYGGQIPYDILSKKKRKGSHFST